jgi:cystathionine beta-lyase/cystathionine gamma-synthase
MLNIVDIKALCDVARQHGIMTCVDNTFASPYLQNPLDLGADLVLHSATKYIGGHSDVIHGCVITKSADLAAQLRFLQNACGAVPGPQDCFLILRGIKTLHLRVREACRNAEKIAAFLQSHPKVDKVFYPGFKTHPNHEIAKKQMRHFGGMVSFDLKGGNLADATTVLSGTKLFALAESLGGVESLIGHPASMTHASIPREERLKVGLTDSLIRLSVGIEDVDDLIEDLEAALAKVSTEALAIL